MNCFLIISIIGYSLAFILLTVFGYQLCRIFYARMKVRKTPQEIKLAYINQIAEEAGFLLDAEGDFFYSKVDAWQKKVGYCSLYDRMAPLFRMLIDCEPVYFMYEEEVYLVEFWKGQYGMSVGAEVGIYHTTRKEVQEAGGVEKAFFNCLDDYRGYYTEFELFLSEAPIAERSKSHWWLTAFKLGIFAKASLLSMNIRIQFPNVMLSRAFYKSLIEAGYQANEVHLMRNVVSIHYNQPKAKQFHISQTYRAYVNRRNKGYIRKYNRCTKKYNKSSDKLYYLKYRYPCIFQAAFGAGRSIRFFKEAYRAIQKV